MNPWAKRAVQGAVCGLAFGLVLLVGGRLWRLQTATAQAKEPAVAQVVKARRFEVVDAAGKLRVTLGMNPNGAPSVMVFDGAGRPRAGLMVGPGEGSILGLYDVAGKPRVALGMNPDGSLGLGMRDAAGETRAALAVRPDVGPVLGLYDAAGKARASLTMRPDGSPGLTLRDAVGKAIWKAP